MFLLALAWNPRTGGGLGVFFARYLFSIGLPVEKWLHFLAELLKPKRDPSASSRKRWSRCCVCLQSRACVGECTM